LTEAIENSLNIELTEENSNIEFSGPTLGSNFYKQLIIALIISFCLMSLVIFFLFRTFVPSIAVIFAAFGDIVMPLALLNILGMKISAAGIAAFLMLIGYSVDTDILLTTRVLKKREGTVNQRIYSSFKTGIFMTLTALLAVLPAFFIVTGLPDSFRQIFLILAIGLFADILNTWLANASIIKWYAEARRL
jgi:preprotein translocase subunit SecF